jgi:hypothetical protein
MGMELNVMMSKEKKRAPADFDRRVPRELPG